MNGTGEGGIEVTARGAERLRRALAEHPYRPAWWLPGAHAQTIFPAWFRQVPSVAARLERWRTPDDDVLRVHIVDGAPGAPAVLLLHGLEGSVQSGYMRGLLHAFASRGWTAVAFEHRTCGGEMNERLRAYDLSDTRDLDFVVRELLARGVAALYLAGTSLGGNHVARWLGEVGASAPAGVIAGAAVSPPFDGTRSGPATDRALFGAYARHFLTSLVAKVEAKAEKFPDRFDLHAVRGCRTLREFDDLVTAPLGGFRDAADYWARSCCGAFLGGVRRPLLLVASADDPFNPGASLPVDAVARSPFLFPQWTRRGGHVGFVSGPSPLAPRYWAEEQVVRFFVAHERLRGSEEI